MSINFNYFTNFGPFYNNGGKAKKFKSPNSLSLQKKSIPVISSSSLISEYTPDYRYNKVLNNIFRDFQFDSDTSWGGNGYETIRILDEGQNFDGYQTIEGNYFHHCDVETEIISVKSRYTTIKNNAFEDNQGLLTFRRGDDNLAEGEKGTL